MAAADRHGLPVTVCTESATPHEVKLVMQTLAEIFVEEPVQRLIGDNAYDSDQLDRELAETCEDDRAASLEPHEPDAGWTRPASLSPPMEDRAAVRMAPELSSAGHALRVLSGELHGHAPSRLCTYPAPPFMRWVLVTWGFGLESLD